MATITRTDETADIGGGAAVSYLAQAIGADSGTDIIYLALGWRSSNSADVVTGITVDGVAATIAEQHSVNDGGGIRSGACIAVIARNDLPDPAQTDIDVVASFNSTTLRGILETYVSSNGVAVIVGTAQATGTGALDLSLDTSGFDGLALGIVFAGDETNGSAWVGLTEVADVTLAGPNRYTTATASDTSNGTLTISCTPTTAVSQVGVSVSFGSPPPTNVVLADSDTFTTGGATHSYTMSLPAFQSANEILLLCFGMRTISNATAFSSVTVDGVAAIRLAEQVSSEGAGVNSYAGIYKIRRGDLPSPTVVSVSVVGTFNSSTLRGACSVYVLYLVEPLASGTASGQATSASTLDLSLTVLDDDIGVGCIYVGDTSTVTWVGITEREEVVLAGPNTWSTAAKHGLLLANPLALTVASTGASARAAIAVVFRAVPTEEEPEPSGPGLSDAAFSQELLDNMGGPGQVPLEGDAWTAGDPYDIEDDGPVRDAIVPGTNSPKIKGIGWRRAMWRLRMAKGF